MTNTSAGGTARPASRIMFAILGSRMLGLVREIILSSLFGAGKELDAFIAAFRIPNLLRDLFAEGALSTAFVTVFSKKLTVEGKEEAFALASRVLCCLTLILGVIVIAGIFASDFLVWVISDGFKDHAGKLELAGSLTRILFPFILLVSLAAVYMGLLNSLGSFGLPASASTVFNAVSIISGVSLGYWIDPSFGPKAIYGIAWGTMIGGLAQWIILLPRAWQYGFRMKRGFGWNDPGLRQVAMLMLPAIIGGSAVQVNVLINTKFASHFGDGSLVFLNNAFRLMQFPIGMFGVAVATVTLPSVSASAAKEQFQNIKAKVVEGVRLALFLTIPASVGLAVLAQPIIALIYQHHRFTASDTAATALVLQAYTIGLAGYACIKVLAPVFAALDWASYPVRVSILGIVINLALNLLLTWKLNFGLWGLALSTSIVALANALQLAFALRSKLGGLDLRPQLFFLGKLLIVSALMAVVSYSSAWAANVILPKHAWFQVFWAVPLGVLVFFGGAFLLKIEEARNVMGILSRRFRAIEAK